MYMIEISGKHSRQIVNGVLKKKRKLAVMRNIDWFQPFKHLSSFSVGGIYLVILNLLRTEKFKRKNVVLAGIIPNMKKEPATNNFLKPMVNELNEAWNIRFNVKSVFTNKVEVFHVALICVVCDIPDVERFVVF